MPQTSKPSHLLAVIVPVYNERDRIADCISQLWETASRQGWKMELIVVDDGSDDGSVEVIRRVIELRSIRWSGVKKAQLAC